MSDHRLSFLLSCALLAGCPGKILDPTAPPTDAPTKVEPQPSEPIVTAGPALGRRLTREEYFNSIEVAVGVQLAVADFELPPDNRVPEGFRNSADDMLLSPARVRAYDAIAKAAVIGMDVAAFVTARGGCTDHRADCYETFVDRSAVVLLRAPITTEERTAFVGLFDVVREEGDTFEAGAALVLRAMLQSPRFLYRLENLDRDTIDDYELATRLSFLVWNAGPDAELLALAAEGRLAASIDAQVQRMLDHPRARRALRQYVEQWLYLDALPASIDIAEDMKEETYRLFEHLAWTENADMMRLFTSERAELSDELAAFYGLEPTADGVYDLSALPERIGVLTNASVIGARTINPESSMIDRGLFVLNDVFCESVAPPSAPDLREAIEEQKVPESSGLSQRERFAMQSEDPLCRSCHSRFDPLGLAFETYGRAGQHITQDVHGNALTGHGVVKAGDLDAPFSNVEEFAQLLAGSKTVERCLVLKSIQHAYGRELAGGDRELANDVQARFVEEGRTYRSLIRTIANHPDFTKMSEVSE